MKKFNIPYFKPYINTNILDNIKHILKTGVLVNGYYTYKLAHLLESKFKGKKALPVDSGTSALILALRILSCENKYVLIPSFVCSALVHAIIQVGAKPLLYDIEYPNIYFDIKKIKEMAPKNLGAVIVVHLFGMAANVEEFVSEFGRKIIIEDCATSFGTYRKNKLCGTFSDVAILSFGPTKYIASVKGGALLVNNYKSFLQASDLFYYDKKNTLNQRYNFLSNEISNLIACSQINNFKSLYSKYRNIYDSYRKGLSDVFDYIHHDSRENNFYKFILLTHKKDFLIHILRNNRIEAKTPIYIPIHRLLGIEGEKFPGSEEFYKTALSLPSYFSLQLLQINKIIKILTSN